jgi:NADP-dependent 3-hydroxy acid dehydrogenase YdfG
MQFDGRIALVPGASAGIGKITAIVMPASDLSDRIIGTAVWIDGAQSLYEG